MAKILEQRVETGSLSLLRIFGVETKNFKPQILAQVPIFATGLLATVDPQDIKLDQYGNPYIFGRCGNGRFSLAAVVVHEDFIFMYNREGKNLQNDNPLPDVIGSIGFGLSAWPFKLPAEMQAIKITSTYWSDYQAVENTDGDGDEATVRMPILVIEVANIDDCEEHFVTIESVPREGTTAKLQAALLAIQEYQNQ